MGWMIFKDVRNTPYIVELLHEAQFGNGDALTELFGIYKGLIYDACALSANSYTSNELFGILERVVERYDLESGIPFSACLRRAFAR